MLDIKYILANQTEATARLLNRGVPADTMGRLLSLYEESKTLKVEADTLKASRNTASKDIGTKQRAGEDASEAIAKMKGVSDRIKAIDVRLGDVDRELENALLVIPNFPLPEVPIGKSDADNKELRKWGEPRRFDFAPKDHVDLGETLGILDFERGAKIAGARFTLLRGAAARMQRALINFMIDIHTKEHGYTEVWPPFLVNRASATGTGNLPKFEEDLFKIADPELFLIPTAEVPVTNIHAQEILAGTDIPMNFVAYTPCFRREAGSYGKDTRGMIRQHQFEKVELVKYVAPENSAAEHEKLTSHAEAILQRLELPYRVMQLCTGDMGFSSARTCDLEVWLPGQNTYREISSCSNFTDFQARRAGIKFRRNAGDKPEFVHTINGSGLAVGRTIVAILENFQQADGSVRVPKALQPYFGSDLIQK